LDIKKFLSERPNYYQVILISRPHNAQELFSLIRNKCPNSTVIYDAEALFSQREIIRCNLSGISLSQADEQKLIKDEIALLKRADIVVTVSDVERNIMVQNGVQNVFIWGHPISVKPNKRGFSEREGILFVGGFLTPISPNEDAMLYFVNEVFPLIQEKLDTQLFIVGTNYLESISNLSSSSIVITGTVENLEEYYERCRVFIVPTRYSAGIPWKLHEAMSYGLPAVVTPLIANQLNLTDGKEVLVGKTPQEFATQVVTLYRSETLWDTIKKAAFSHIDEVCNPNKLKQNIKDTLKKFA
jgi:glycosyltransferase involved in cell wall biosynthesis